MRIKESTSTKVSRTDEKEPHRRKKCRSNEKSAAPPKKIRSNEKNPHRRKKCRFFENETSLRNSSLLKNHSLNFSPEFIDQKLFKHSKNFTPQTVYTFYSCDKAKPGHPPATYNLRWLSRCHSSYSSPYVTHTPDGYSDSTSTDYILFCLVFIKFSSASKFGRNRTS